MHARLIRDDLITQEELESLISLRNQAFRAQRIYNDKASAVLDRVLAGGTVEEGTHILEIERNEIGPQRTTSLVIY